MFTKALILKSKQRYDKIKQKTIKCKICQMFEDVTLASKLGLLAKVTLSVSPAILHMSSILRKILDKMLN